MSILKRAAITLACLAFFAIGTHASAGNVYIAQSATGAANGADCSDAYPVSFFNPSGNWGSGSKIQIGPGTTVHLCGTFTGAAGSTMLTIQGSGASGSPVTILFESGAVFAAPYWEAALAGSAGPGAIQCSGYSYITIDGGANGIIENTANGSASLGFANQQGSTGVFATNCPHFTVQGSLSVINIFMHAENDPVTNATGGTSAIWVQDSDGISITGATINNAFVPLNVGYDPGSPITSGNRRTQYHR